MSRVLLAVVIAFLFVLPATAAEKSTQKIQITSIGYRAVPWSNTSYIPGQTNTECYGTGTVWGNTTDLNVNCSTVTSPDIPVTVSKLFVYNQVETSDYQYLITCTRNWVGSKCTWMNVGQSFDAEESGDTMNVYAYMSYNDQLKGKLTRVKFDIRNKTPKTSHQISTPQQSLEQPNGSYTSQFQAPGTQVWSQEPTGFRGLNFGMTYDEAKSKEPWMATAPRLNPKGFCGPIYHTIGAIKVRTTLYFFPTLTSVLIDFSNENFELMKSIFIEKYGPPHTSKRQTKKNRSGIEVQDETYWWKGSTMTVILEKCFGDNFQSSAFISTNDAGQKSIKTAADDF